MSWFSSLFGKKTIPAPRPVVLDDFVNEKLGQLIDDIVYLDFDRKFSSRNELIDFIHDKLNTFRPKDDNVKQNPSEPPKKIQRIKLKPLTGLLD